MTSLIFANYRKIGRIEKYASNWGFPEREPFKNSTTDIKELERAIDKKVLYGSIILFLHDLSVLPYVNELINSEYVPIFTGRLRPDHSVIVMVNTAFSARDVCEELFYYLRINCFGVYEGCVQGLIKHDVFREYYSKLISKKQINYVKEYHGEIEEYFPFF